MLSALTTFFIKHERPLSILGLVSGFVFDIIFFQRIDLLFENVGIIAHLVIGLFAIALMHVHVGWYRRHHLLEKLRALLPFVLQFAFGGLFGKFVIFYTKSGTISSSWPFLVLLVVLFIGNEFFRSRYERLTFRLAIFFTALFSYCIVLIPILTKTVSAGTFLLSGILSLALMDLVLRGLDWFSRDIDAKERRELGYTLLCIYAVFNVMYFANIIPPIPLAMEAAGVYHNITRLPNGAYRVTAEEPEWLDYLRQFDRVPRLANEPIFVYTAIFSPTRFNLTVFHHWRHYDESVGQWKTIQRVELPIAGGRDGGFRTYSLRTSPEEGYWRVDVETVRRQLIGRINFKLEDRATPPKFVTAILD
ncbi:MAG: hypothetical protein COV10_03310 [Candidatus Vogelbacteria bacterium CG10_big_fil_rev_8_21_14_0_10_51_16]|uniref:DUF2914 domain-containing protein n=1 Tax=Candidatus Vogelbacteria bacterium CG10_big_fil_rev_8_21_14_0_10_51_16 TaxID=1975045 RepID=A0A2H0RFX1_9BACT|nr:MAG: hypothetical protein COV10_03310 [Candidatus Vogelbacteria bacterium CG10_big_fil_rev_8_21_14_0_10_51_16]